MNSTTTAIKSHLLGRMLDSWDKSDKQKLANKTFPRGVVEKLSIHYTQAKKHEHSLDVYYPEGHRGQLPVLVDIHGGGFMCNDKESTRLFGYHIARRGFLVFNLNYRLALSNVKVTDQIQDIAHAAAWISEHLAEFGGDPGKVYISGHSAGAVLAISEVLNSQSSRLRDVFRLAEVETLQYLGLALNCGFMIFYQRTLAYRLLRQMVFPENYENDDRYHNMIWNQIPELAALPKTFLSSNKKDELRNMTRMFKQILDERGVPNHMNYQTTGSLGHMAIIYDPGSAECSAVIDEMVGYLLA